MKRLFCNSKQLEAWWKLNEKHGTLRALQLFNEFMELEQSIKVFCDEDLDYQMIEELNERVCEDRPILRRSDITFSDLRDPDIDCDYDG